MRSRYSLALGCMLAVLVSACGGGSGAGFKPIPSATSTATASPAPAQQTPNVNFVMHIPALTPTSSNAVRSSSVHPMDFTDSTMSVTIAIGTQVLTTANVSATSSSCTAASAGGRNCTVGVSAPTGSDTFTVTAYDQANGAGTAIASSTMVETVSSTPTTVSVAITGTVVKLAVALSNPYPPVGTAATSAVTVTGVDADGNVVLGPYASPITLSDSDATGATSLSTTTLTGSSSTGTLNYNGAESDATITITAAMSGAGSATATFAVEPGFISDYDAPTNSNNPSGTPEEPGIWEIALGSDGNMWVGCTGIPEIIKVTSSGSTTVYPLPGNGPGANSIVLGSDGNMWVANEADAAIVQVTTAGVATPFAIQQTGQSYAIPDEVGLGPDGNVWFDDGWNQLYGKITPTGVITEYPTYGTNHGISAITAGPDGNVWMTDAVGNQVWKVSPSTGQVTNTYAIPTANSGPSAITVGPDGNLWVSEQNGNKIARVTTSGTITEFAVPTPNAFVGSIAAGPDGRIWFGEQGPPAGIGKIGYVTTDGTQIRDFISGSGYTGYKVHGIAFDANKLLWYIALDGYNQGAGQMIGTFEY